MKTAAGISSEAAVAGIPSMLDKRTAKSLLASCSESDESCGGGTGIDPIPHSSPSRGGGTGSVPIPFDSDAIDAMVSLGTS